MAECLLGNVNDEHKGICVKIINFFIGKGFTPAQALGICANVYKESSYIVGNENDKSGAYGLFQWYDTRKGKFFDFCTKYDYKRTSVDAQLAYCWEENYPDWQGAPHFREYYFSHKGMSSMESLIWWEETWERCQGNTEYPCDRKTRIAELHRLENLYKSNVKTDDCSTNFGGDSSDNVCEEDFRTLSYEQSETNNTKSKSKNTPSGFNLKEPFLPLGSGKENTKPVIFGGSWAFKSSPYMFDRGYLSYASWHQCAFSYQKANPKTVNGKKDGPKVKRNKGYYGLKENYLNHDNLICTKDYIQRYLAKKENKPEHIVVQCGLNDTSFAKDSPRNNIVSRLQDEYTEIFNAAGGTTIYIVSFGPSYRDKEKYKIFNEAIRNAVVNFPTANVKYVEMSDVCTAILNEFHKDGKNKPGNGLFCEDGWKVYANYLMQQTGKN